MLLLNILEEANKLFICRIYHIFIYIFIVSYQNYFYYFLFDNRPLPPYLGVYRLDRARLARAVVTLGHLMWSDEDEAVLARAIYDPSTHARLCLPHKSRLLDPFMCLAVKLYFMSSAFQPTNSITF